MLVFGCIEGFARKYARMLLHMPEGNFACSWELYIHSVNADQLPSLVEGKYENTKSDMYPRIYIYTCVISESVVQFGCLPLYCYGLKKDLLIMCTLS